MAIPDAGANPRTMGSEISGPGDTALPAFADIPITVLDAADASYLDRLGFGVIGLNEAGRTERYNLLESQLGGLSRDNVLGQEFFLTTGICMNNFLVAQRFEDEPELDVILDYVLTFRMRPTPVKLRLLQHPDIKLRYILVLR
jgi:photoactive yellow protein